MYYNADKTVTYDGEWENGLRSGYGIMKYASGNYYEGNWSKDKKNGVGVMIWKDVDEIYTGEWKDDRCEGFGEHLWGHGATSTSGGNWKYCNLYRGEWKGGIRAGRGSFFYSDGSQYTGDWANNLKEGEGTFIQTNGKIHRGLFAKDRSVSGEAARATDNVCVQIHLHIEDVIDIHPHPYSDTKDGISPQTPQELKASLEKLLLRFHTQMKTIYKRYTEVSHKRRHREQSVCPADATLVEKAIFKARNIHKRINCMSMRQLKQFAREMGVINNISYTASDVTNCFKRMKYSRRILAKRASVALALQKTTEKYAKISAEQRKVEIQAIVDKIADIDQLISADITNHEQVATWREEITALKNEMQSLETKPYSLSSEELNERDSIRESVKDIDPYLYFEDFLHESSGGDPLDDLRQPLTESDFYEMIVRIIADASVRDEYVLESSSSPRSTPCIYDAVFKFLSVKVLPYYNELHNKQKHECFSEWSKLFHEDHMEKALAENEEALQKIWSNVTKLEGGSSSCTVNGLLTYMKSLQPKYVINEATEWAILRELEILPTPPTITNADEILPPPAPEEPAEGGENPEQAEGAAIETDDGKKAENEDEEVKAEETPPPPPPYRARMFNVVPTRADLASKYFDASVLNLTVEFDGFVEFFCKLINSELWRSVHERRILEDIESIEKSRTAAEELAGAADAEDSAEEAAPSDKLGAEGTQEESLQLELPVVPQHLLEKRENAFDGKELAGIVSVLLKHEFGQ